MATHEQAQLVGSTNILIEEIIRHLDTLLKNETLGGKLKANGKKSLEKTREYLISSKLTLTDFEEKTKRQTKGTANPKPSEAVSTKTK